MATAQDTRIEGESWSTLVTEGSIPSTLRKQGIDEATSLTYLTRQWTPFTWWLHSNYKATKHIVNDRMYKTREVVELDWFYTVQYPSGTASGDAGVERVVGVTNQQAAEIQPEDVFYIRDLFANVIGNPMVAGQVYPASGGVQGTNVGPDLGWKTGMNPINIKFSRTKGKVNDLYFCDFEQVQVAQKGAKDSGGTGITLLFLDRCYMGPNAKDEGGLKISNAIVYGSATNVVGIYDDITNQQSAARIVRGDVLLRAAPAFKEGTNYPSGVYKNPTTDSNFTQLFKYAVEKTLESDIPALWIKDRPLDINRWMCLLRMNRDREFANLLGRKTMDRDADGKEKYLMGGVREFIPKDPEHYLYYPGNVITYPGCIDFTKWLLELSNSCELWGITGITLYNELVKSFWNDKLWYNKEESQNFNMSVKTLMIGEIKINIIVSQIFEYCHFGNELMLLDMVSGGGDSFEPVTNEGWDMKVDKDIAEKGSNIYKEGIQGMFGLRRRRASKHAIINFQNAVSL